MKWKNMAIVYGVMFSLSVVTVVILFPARSDEAFTCFAQHLAQKWSSLWGQESSFHAWPLAPSLCGWVVGLLMAGTSAVGIVRLLRAAHREQMCPDV